MSEECFRDGCKKRKYIMTDEEINDFGVSCPYCRDPIEDEDLAPVIFSHLAANARIAELEQQLEKQNAIHVSEETLNAVEKNNGDWQQARIRELEKEIARLKERDSGTDDIIADFEQKVKDFDLVKIMNKRCCEEIELLKREIAVRDRAMELLHVSIPHRLREGHCPSIPECVAQARAEIEKEGTDGSKKAE